MQFNIAAFTHRGTSRPTNQDHIMVNGKILNDGEINVENQETCCCFVADGVGGNNAGEFASEFVLRKIAQSYDRNADRLAATFSEINQQLLVATASQPKLSGAATTLTGVIIEGKALCIFHAGDSQLWIFRNEMLLKLTTDHVFDEMETNSPITNYFGGTENYLAIDTSSSGMEIFASDLFMLCSDGIVKALSTRSIKSILNSGTDIHDQTNKMFSDCLEAGAIDNISLILIQPII